MNRIEGLYAKHPDAPSFARGYLEYLSEMLAKVNVEAIAHFTDVLLDAQTRGARIFFLGNGGSAATASHFANDIAIGSQSWERPFRAISLADNIAAMTAIANDHGYEHVFTQQLRAHLSDGDVVVAISVSGNSPNVIHAVEFAQTRGARTIGLTGFDGGRLREIVDVSLHVPTESGEYGPAEDVHMVFDHLIGTFLMLHCRTQV